MLELGAGADILRSLGWLYNGLIAILIGAALWFPKRGWQKAVGVLAVLLVFTGPAYLRSRESNQIADTNKARYEAAKALFDERCKTAGEKIYRTVDNVEGVLLLNIRDDDRIANEANPNWRGAGFPKESGGHQYIMEFLYYHHVPTDSLSLHNLLPKKGEIRGYRYVDVEEDGQRIRYSLRKASEQSTAADPIKAYGIRRLTTESRPPFVVTYEEILDPEGRAQWIAGARIKVIDTRSDELLGEFIRYSFEPGFGSKEGQRQPWAFARECPMPNSNLSTTGHIRFFVEKVLKPKQEE